MCCLGRSAPSKAHTPSPPPQMLFCWGFATIPPPPTALTPCFLPLRPLAFYGSFPPLPPCIGSHFTPCIRFAFGSHYPPCIRLAFGAKALAFCLHSARILLAFGSRFFAPPFALLLPLPLSALRLTPTPSPLCIRPPLAPASPSDPHPLSPLRLTLTALHLTPRRSRLCV